MINRPFWFLILVIMCESYVMWAGGELLLQKLDLY